MMDEIEQIIGRAYDLGALAASEPGFSFYRKRGWQAWRGETFVVTPTGLIRTPREDGAILVLPLAEPLNLDAHIACDWRDGDVW